MKYDPTAVNNAQKMLSDVGSGQSPKPVWVHGGRVTPASEGTGLLEQIVADFESDEKENESPTEATSIETAQLSDTE